MYKVIKRDGKVVDFNIEKISTAIKKAFDGVDKKYHQDVIDMLALKVTSGFDKYIKDDKIQVEKIQDLVEITLISSGYADVAKAYILYRKQREKTRNLRSTMLGYKELVSSYVENEVNKNADINSPYSIGGLVLSNSGEITANYWLSEVYDEEITKAHTNGDIYISGLSSLTGSDSIWSIKKIISKGLNGIDGMVKSGPANHLSTITMHLSRFLSIVQNEWTGTQTFNNFDTYLAPFIKKDKLSYVDVKQIMQTFVYEINTPNCVGMNTPLTQIGLDINVPEKLKDEKCLIRNEKLEFTYADCKEEIKMIDKALFEVMNEGDYEGNNFAYPGICIKADDGFVFEDNELNKLIFNVALKYPNIYFANAKGKKAKNAFGQAEDGGSIGLVTLNLVRLVKESQNPNDFYKACDKVLELALRALQIKKNIIVRLFDNNLYPLTRFYIDNLNKYTCNIGLIGLNEVCLNATWLKKDLNDEESRKFIIELLAYLKSGIARLSKEYKETIVLRKTDSLTAGYVMAKLDKEKDSDIITSTDDKGAPYYAGDINYEDLFAKLDFENRIQKNLNGVSPVHIGYKDKLDYKEMMLLLNKVVDNYDIKLIGK